jgi:hypothetical protein
MKLHQWMCVALTLMVVGCRTQTTTTERTTGAISPEQVAGIRASYKQQNPRVEVGVVMDVLPNENLAAMGDVDVSLFHDGDIVCFVDSTTAPLVCGKVVRVTDTQVHVKYENPAADRRAPMAGDLGVAFR